MDSKQRSFLPVLLTNMADRSTEEKSKNKNDRRIPCTFEGCNAVFKKNAHLIRHALIHNDEAQIPPKDYLLHDIYGRQRNLIAFSKFSSMIPCDNQERPYECKFQTCGKAFRSPCHLKRHEATHNEEKKFKCEVEGCDVTCQTLWNLKRHVKRTHCGTFKCGKCNKHFKKNKLLQQHIAIEHNTCCEFPGCGMIFSVPSKMRHHMKAHTQKGHNCPVKGCSMTFQLWSACRQHAAQCKNKEESCEICGKVFTKRSNLKAHMKIHSEEREVYQCSYDGCGRFYTKQSNLKAHIQSFHQNIRPFVCPKSYCNKSFHFQHLLRNHLELHTKNHDDKKEQKSSETKRKRSRRMVTSTTEALTGYIPSLWKKMTPEEVREYVEQGMSSSFYAETDVIQHDDDDDETTQVELTPVSSGELDRITIKAGESNPYNVPSGNKERKMLSDETLTAFTDLDQSEEEEEVILQPMKSLAEACSYLEQNRYRPSLSTTTSTSSSRFPSANVSANVSADSGEDGEKKLIQWEDTLKSIVNAKRQAMNQSPTVLDSCHMQSVTESDSSDTETKKKVQMLMQQCAS